MSRKAEHCPRCNRKTMLFPKSGLCPRCSLEETTCYFAQFAGTPCDGRMDRAHAIPQRILKREWSRANPRVPTAWHVPSPLTGTDLDELLNDPRNIVRGCRFHHGNGDNYRFEVRWPDSAYQFAAAYELEHFLPIKEPA